MKSFLSKNFVLQATHKTSDSLILFVSQESLKSKLLGWNTMTSFQYLFIFVIVLIKSFTEKLKRKLLTAFKLLWVKIANWLFLLSFTVRQENERLIQESMIRARMAANFTDAPPVIPPTTSSPSHPTLKVLQGNFVP